MELAPAGAVASVAVTLARGLARYRDPDQVDPGAGLPRAVRLLEAAGSADPSSEELIGRWSDGGAGLDAVLGVTATGPIERGDWFAPAASEPPFPAAGWRPPGGRSS